LKHSKKIHEEFFVKKKQLQVQKFLHWVKFFIFSESLNTIQPKNRNFSLQFQILIRYSMETTFAKFEFQILFTRKEQKIMFLILPETYLQ
jgi:hypothetical protein